MSKRLGGFAMALWGAALVAGCHSTKSSSSHGTTTMYSQPGATASTSSQPSGGTSSVYWQEQGAGRSATSAESPSATIGQGQVSIPLYEEQIVVGTRPVEAGSVRLRKQVTTETVNQPVQIRRETLVVDREAAPEGQQTSLTETGTPATAGTSGGISTPFEQGEIVIKLHKEEPVIEKRVVSTGRIVAQTRTNTEQTTVQREIRKEKIDVEKIGNPENVTISEKVGEKSKNEAVGGTGTGSEQTKGQQNNQKPSDSQKSQDNQKQQDNPKQDEKTPGQP